MPANNPYLIDGRLGDVISAIQVLGSNEAFLARPAFWAERITGDSKNAEACEKLFLEHKEFFRRYGEPHDGSYHYSLIWRHSLPYIDKQTGLHLSTEEFRKAKGKSIVGRRALQPDEIKSLTDMATTLHGRAVDQYRDWRWWVSPILSFVGALSGTILAFVAAALWHK